MFIELKNPVSIPTNFWKDFTWIGETLLGQGMVSETNGCFIDHSDVYQAENNMPELMKLIPEVNLYINKGDFVIIETSKVYNDEGDEIDEVITGIGDALSSDIYWLKYTEAFKSWLKEKMTIRVLPDIINEDIHA